MKEIKNKDQLYLWNNVWYENLGYLSLSDSDLKEKKKETDEGSEECPKNVSPNNWKHLT